MKIKIAKDTPVDLIELFKKIDINKIPKSEHDQVIDQLKEVAKKHIPIRKGQPIPILIELDGCPQRLATIVSQFDFKALGTVKRKAGLAFIKGWLKRHGLLK